MSKQKFLLRYTNLASLFEILLNKRICLLDPDKWEDRNDSYYIQVYKGEYSFESVLAICFAETNETFHHWKVFSGNISGVCIEFDKGKLLNDFKNVSIPKDAKMIIRKVKYPKINHLKANPPKAWQLPFIKRHPYRDEKELRVIYSDKVNKMASNPISINLSCINQVLLSPLVPDALMDSLKIVINGIKNCDNIRVIRSTLIDNEKWKNIATDLQPSN